LLDRLAWIQRSDDEIRAARVVSDGIAAAVLLPVEDRVDVMDATSAAVHSLRSTVPGAVQKRLQEGGPQFRPAFRSDREHECYANPLDGFAVRGFAGLVCHEQAFQYLLDIERRRAESTQRPFLLMLIEWDDPHGALIPARAVGPERVFPIVCKSIRETDFVGWYRQGTVMGATLTQDGRRGTKQAGSVVRERVVKAFSGALPHELASQLRLGLFEVLGDDQVRIE
jgi:hypothetical protein